jgi:transcriptional regulator with XRE-family HTH domain
MGKKEENGQKHLQLGAYLRELRELRGLKLREVEEASGVSNAYLSQIETGKITRPSPRILHKLASVYDVGYEVVMEKAGYLARRGEPGGESKPVVPGTQIPAVALQDLSPAEEKAVLEYIAFLRHRRNQD